MNSTFATTLLVFFKLSFAYAPIYENKWVVWNTGQGQWVTHILSLTCIHYDFGGELGTFKRLRQSFLKNCATKENRLNLSHWDYDHYLQLTFLVKTTPSICWQTMPPVVTMKVNIQKVLDLKIPFCSTDSNEAPTQKWLPPDYHSTNEASIVQLDQDVLIPGDSTIQKEKKWISSMQHLQNVRVLVLGHHGSNTSTGRDLLRHLPKLRWAIASARKARYGHPHTSTLLRLKKSSVPVLKTEDWGNIWY